MPADSVRVAVYLDSEESQKLAEEVLDPPAPGERGRFSGVAEGWLTRAELTRLNDAGLIIELLDTEAPAGEAGAAAGEAVGGPARTLAESTGLIEDIKQQSSTVSFADDESQLVLGVSPTPDHDPRLHHSADYDATPTREQALPEDVYNIDIRGPITREQRLELDKLEVDIAAFEPDFGYRAFLTREQYAAVLKLPYVAGVTRYSFEQAMTPELLEVVREDSADDQPQLMGGEGQAASQPQTFDCLLHREDDLAKIRELIDHSADATIVGTSNLRIRFRADVHVPFLAALAALPEVRKLSPFEPPSL